MKYEKKFAQFLCFSLDWEETGSLDTIFLYQLWSYCAAFLPDVHARLGLYCIVSLLIYTHIYYIYVTYNTRIYIIYTTHIYMTHLAWDLLLLLLQLS